MSTTSHDSAHDELDVVVLAFDDMEVLDYAGPYEVFNVAGELASEATPRFRVRSVGVRPGPVTGRGGFTVVPEMALDDVTRAIPDPDVLVIPGGSGSRALLEDPQVLAWVHAASTGSGVVASVCTGALVLAAAGLLDNGQATTHHGAFDELAQLSPSARIRRGERFVSVDGDPRGRLWTSGGISAGIDLSLHLVEILGGVELRAAVEEEMEWLWNSTGH